MAYPVKEANIEEIKAKLDSMNTDLNKLAYLEIAIKEPKFNYEIKRFLWDETAKLYEQRKMFEKAARAVTNKASMEVSLKDRIESYLRAAELYCKAGKVDSADDIFLKASRECNDLQKAKIALAKKNIYMHVAVELEKSSKKASALKFYEKLIKMHIDPIEKKIVKRKLIEIYKSLGMFREAKLAEGL